MASTTYHIPKTVYHVLKRQITLLSWLVLVHHFKPATCSKKQPDHLKLVWSVKMALKLVCASRPLWTCSKNSRNILSWMNEWMNPACYLNFYFVFFLQNPGSKQSVVCSSPLPVFMDQGEHGSLVSLDALEVMSECDMPIAFTRGSRSRASLPVVRSTNQTKDRSLGIQIDMHILSYIHT